MGLGGLGADGDYEEIPDTEGMEDEKGGFLNDEVVNKLVDSTLEPPRIIEVLPNNQQELLIQ